MILVITVMLTFAPRLFRLARRFGYITPVDYVFHRFGSHKLRVLSVILLCWGLANYILEQLVAMGHAVEGISSGRIPFMAGVLILVVVMLVYESLGGMRSVAWTDVIQGTLLLFGCACILYILLTLDERLRLDGFVLFVIVVPTLRKVLLALDERLGLGHRLRLGVRLILYILLALDERLGLGHRLRLGIRQWFFFL